MSEEKHYTIFLLLFRVISWLSDSVEKKGIPAHHKIKKKKKEKHYGILQSKKKNRRIICMY